MTEAPPQLDILEEQERTGSSEAGAGFSRPSNTGAKRLRAAADRSLQLHRSVPRSRLMSFILKTLRLQVRDRYHMGRSYASDSIVRFPLICE